MRNVRHWSDSLVFVITADVRLTDGAVVEVDRRRCRANGPIYSVLHRSMAVPLSLYFTYTENPDRGDLPV